MTPETARKTLLARRDELLASIAKLDEQIRETTPGDAEDAEDMAQDRQGDEVLTALGEHDVAEIARIDAALDRIANGAYGDCVQCGNKIAEKRLELLPDTPFCANCAP